MNRRNVSPKPKWWQLYLTFPLLMGLFLLDTRLRISTGGHEIVQLGSLFLEFGLVQAWMKANAGALSHMDEQEFARTIRVIEIPPTPRDTGQTDRQVLTVSPTEIAGLLGDTFEMDYIDANSCKADAPENELAKAHK